MGTNPSKGKDVDLKFQKQKIHKFILQSLAVSKNFENRNFLSTLLSLNLGTFRHLDQEDFNQPRKVTDEELLEEESEENVYRNNRKLFENYFPKNSRYEMQYDPQ